MITLLVFAFLLLFVLFLGAVAIVYIAARSGRSYRRSSYRWGGSDSGWSSSESSSSYSSSDSGSGFGGGDSGGGGASGDW